MAEQQDQGPRHERLADELFALSLSNDADRQNAAQKAADMLSGADRPGIAARALDFLRVASQSEEPNKNPSHLTCYTYSRAQDSFWALVWARTRKDVSFDILTDRSEYAPGKTMPCRYITLLMYKYMEDHNIDKYATLNSLTRERAEESYRAAVNTSLLEDKARGKFECSVATRVVTSNSKSKLHWRLFGGKKTSMFMPYRYLLEPWSEVNLDGKSKKKGKLKISFFWMPRVYSDLHWNTQVKPDAPAIVSTLVLRNLSGLRFVCDGNIGVHWFTDELSVRTCETGMNYSGLRTLALEGMPLECIVWSDLPVRSLTSVSVIDTSRRNYECEGQFFEGAWRPLSCGPEFRKLGVVKIYGNNFGLERADCPNLRELHFGGHPLPGTPGVDEYRFYSTTDCPAISQSAPLRKLVFRSPSLMRLDGDFPRLHRVGDESNLPLYPNLEEIGLINVAVPDGDFLDTIRFVNDGNTGPKTFEIRNLGLYGPRPALGMPEDGPPIVDLDMDQGTFDELLMPQINCTTLTIVKMPEVVSIRRATRNMSKLASLEISELGESEGLSLSPIPLKNMQKCKHVGIEFDRDTRVAIAGKSPKKSKKGQVNVEQNAALSPQRSPPSQVTVVEFDPFLDEEEEEEQGQNQEEQRADLMALVEDTSRCLGSPWTTFDGRPSNWAPWYKDVRVDDPRSLEYLDTVATWDSEAIRWITGENWEMIYVEPLEGEEVAEIRDPEEGFGFDVEAHLGIGTRKTTSIFMETEVGLNASESGLFYEEGTFTYEAFFLQEADVLLVEETRDDPLSTPEIRTSRVMQNRRELLNALRAGTCTFSFPLTRGQRHLGFAQAADLGVEDADLVEAMNVESTTDLMSTRIAVEPFALSATSAPNEASGLRYRDTENPNVFLVEYADTSVRPDMGAPAGPDNEFVMNMGTLTFKDDGSFSFSFSCSTPIRLLGLQYFKALAFFMRSTWEQQRQERAGGRGKGAGEEVEAESTRIPPLFRTINPDGSIPSADAEPFRLVDTPPFEILKNTLLTVFSVANQIGALSAYEFGEREWAASESSVERFSRQATLIFAYTMGRAMQSVLSMPYFSGSRSPVAVQFSRIFEFYIAPIMRWCCQNYPRDMAPSMDLSALRLDDIMGLLASANGAWGKKDKAGDEENANKKYAMNLYSRVLSATRQLINNLEGLCEDHEWREMDEAIQSCLTVFNQMEGVLFGDDEEDVSKLKTKLSRHLVKALGSKDGRSKGSRGAKKLMTEGAGGVIDAYFGNQEEIEQLIVQQAEQPRELNTGLLLGPDFGDEDDDQDDAFIVPDEEEEEDERGSSQSPSPSSGGARSGSSPSLMEMSPESPLEGSSQIITDIQALVRKRKQRSPDAPSYIQIKSEVITKIQQDSMVIDLTGSSEEDPEEAPPTPVSRAPPKPPLRGAGSVPGMRSPPQDFRRKRKQSAPQRRVVAPPLPSVAQMEEDLESAKRRASTSPQGSPIHGSLKKRVKAREASPQSVQALPPAAVVVEEEEDDDEEAERAALETARALKERASRLHAQRAAQQMQDQMIPPPIFRQPQFSTPQQPPKQRRLTGVYSLGSSPIATFDGRDVQAFGPPQPTAPMLQERTTESEMDRMRRKVERLRAERDEAQRREMALLRTNLEREQRRADELQRQLERERERQGQGQGGQAQGGQKQGGGRTDASELMAKICAVCSSDSVKGMCPKCKSVFYCGKEHYKEHYHDHKKECSKK